jgi:DNA-binding NarL/FixJ family response regulator
LHTSRFTVVGKITEIWPDPGEVVNMYRRSVLSLVPELARSTNTEIVIVTMRESRSFARHALAAGAIGFVAKRSQNAHLPQGMRRAVCREEYVGPQSASVAPPRYHAGRTAR